MGFREAVRGIINSMKAYLLALEIDPVKIGATYDSLPLHCTLVHWFWAESDEFITPLKNDVKGLSAPILHILGEEVFTGFTKTGTVPVRVNTVMKTDELTSLHEKVAGILEVVGVTYEKPEYIHEGYAAHVTHQKGAKLSEGDTARVAAVYLVSADAPAYGNPRKIIDKFTFKA